MTVMIAANPDLLVNYQSSQHRPDTEARVQQIAPHTRKGHAATDVGWTIQTDQIADSQQVRHTNL